MSHVLLCTSKEAISNAIESKRALLYRCKGNLNHSGTYLCRSPLFAVFAKQGHCGEHPLSVYHKTRAGQAPVSSLLKKSTLTPTIAFAEEKSSSEKVEIMRMLNVNETMQKL